MFGLFNFTIIAGVRVGSFLIVQIVLTGLAAILYSSFSDFYIY